MLMDIRKEISENNVVVMVIPNKKYSSTLLENIKQLSSVYSKICYVSLSTPYEELTENFKKSGIDNSKFFFIDCITEKIKEARKDNILYVSSPRALTELNITINKVLDMNEIPLTIFDSLSTLLVYEGSMTVIKFMHSIISTFRTYGAKCVFTCMKDDINADMMKDLNMFADRLIETE